MKKVMMIVCMFFMLIGCTFQPKNQEDLRWEGKYQNENIILNIKYDEDYLDGIDFQFETDGESFDNYAHFTTDDQRTAIYDVEESGYILTFSLRNDKIVVKESDGITFKDISLTGQYAKK